MKDNKEIMCDECKKSVPIEQIRYGVRGNQNLRLCSECRDRTTPRSSKKLNIKIIHEEPKKEIKVERSVSNFSQNKDDYLCTRCRYKFPYDKMGEGKLRCPYCSSVDYITSSKSLSSGNILKNLKDSD